MERNKIREDMDKTRQSQTETRYDGEKQGKTDANRDKTETR